MIVGEGTFRFTLPDPARALRLISPSRGSGLEPRDGLAEAMGSVGFLVWFVSILESLVMGVPIDRPMSDVFREVLLLLLELTAGCLARVEELDPSELEGSWVEFGRPMRDDLLELVTLRLGLLVAGVIGPPRRVRLFELTAGCLAVVEVDDFPVVICLPIRERVLLFELVIDRFGDVEFEGCLVAI